MKKIAQFSIAAVILALGLILSSALLSKLFVNIKHEKEIAVKGYAEKNIVSDQATFYCSYSAQKPTMVEAYEKLQANKKIIIEYLRDKGIKSEEIDVEEIDTTKIYEKDLEGNDTNEVQYYLVRQGIKIRSKNVKLVRGISREITELIKNGVDISAYSPCFFVSNLDEIKIELLAKATKDGHQRAMTLANNSGGKVGVLRSAKQGVFQITAPNSTAISGYGEYDTSTINKTIKAVVTLEYSIE